MKNTKRFLPAWPMLLILASLSCFAQEGVVSAQTAVISNADENSQLTTVSDLDKIADASEEIDESELTKDEFLKKELLEMYRQDEVVITYFFMSEFFPLVMQQCNDKTKKDFEKKFTDWQEKYKNLIDSGNSIFKGRFKDDPKHLQQVMFFALQQLQMQSGDFQESLCAEVLRVVTPEKERKK